MRRTFWGCWAYLLLFLALCSAVSSQPEKPIDWTDRFEQKYVEHRLRGGMIFGGNGHEGLHILWRRQNFKEPADSCYGRGRDTVLFGNGGVLKMWRSARVDSVGAYKPKMTSVARHTAAFTTSSGNLFVHYEGATEMIADKAPSNWSAGEGTVAGYDWRSGNLRVWTGQWQLISKNAPTRFEVGEKTVAYLESDGRFQVWENGKIETISRSAPLSFKVGAGVVAYLDSSKSLHEWHHNHDRVLESERPIFYFVARRSVRFVSKYGKAKVWREGKVELCDLLQDNDGWD